jgi:hypothetical protein
MVSEVKAKGPDSISGLSYTSKTVNGRQMDASWVSNGLNKIGIDADSQDVGESIHTELIQVDFGQNTLATFNLDSNGIRTDSSPNEIYSLGEIQNIIDDKNDPRVENRGKL